MAAAIADVWMRGDHDAAERSVSDASIDATSVAGTQCRARVEAYRQSRIDVPILSPFARCPDAKPPVRSRDPRVCTGEVRLVVIKIRSSPSKRAALRYRVASGWLARPAAQQRQSLPGQPSRTRNRFMRTLLRRRLAASGRS